MPTFGGQTRLNRQKPKERRNAARFASGIGVYDPNSPITLDGQGRLVLTLSATGGLQTVSSALGIKLDSTPGLVLGAGGIKVLLDPTEPGLQLTSGLKVLLAGTPGLELSSGLKAKVVAPIIIGASGIALDGTANWTTTGKISGGTAEFGTSPNYSQFEADGTFKMNGTATVFDDLVADAIGIQQTGTGLSRNATESTVDYTTLANLSDYLYVNVQLPHKWKVDSVIHPHIHWIQPSNNVANFLLQYRWQKLGGTKTTSWTNLLCNTAKTTYTSGDMHAIAGTSAGITPSGGGISDIIQFRIIRDNANTSTLFAGADPIAATVAVLAFDIHVESDTLGSRTEYSK